MLLLLLLLLLLLPLVVQLVQSKRSQEHVSRTDADLIFFFVGGLASLTLLINATTAERCLAWLGLLSEDASIDKLAVQFQIRKQLRQMMMKVRVCCW